MIKLTEIINDAKVRARVRVSGTRSEVVEGRRCGRLDVRRSTGSIRGFAQLLAVLIIAGLGLALNAHANPSAERKVMYFSLKRTLKSPDPHVALGRVFTVNDQLVVQLGETDIARVEPTLNRIEWRKTPGGVIRHLFVTGDTLLVVADDVSAWTIADGTRKWTYPLAMQTLLSVDANAVVVAGFGDTPTQIAMVDLQTGGVAWPSWAMIDRPMSVVVEQERLLVTSEGVVETVIPVDRSTGRVRAAIPTPPGLSKKTDNITWKAERFGDRVLIISDNGAGWINSPLDPVVLGQGSQVVVQVGTESHLYEGVPLLDAVDACQRRLNERGETDCVGDLLPLSGKLPGVEGLAPAALKSLASRIADPGANRQAAVDMAVKLLPMVRDKDGKSDRSLVVRFARVVIALSNAGEHHSAQRLLAELVPLAGTVQLQGLAFAIQLAHARAVIQDGQRAMQRGDRELAVACLDDLVTLASIAGMLPPEIVDARDGDKQLRAAYKAVVEGLPAVGGATGQNQSMCMAECGLDRDECGSHPRCKDLYNACIVGCAPDSH